MSASTGRRLFGDLEVIDTPGGVVWRFRGLSRSSPFGLSFFLPLLVIGAIPAAAAVVSLVFLLTHATQLPWYLIALSGLFVIQTGLVVTLCLRLAGWFLFRTLFDLFGHHEMELRQGLLYWGKRAGPFRQGYRHEVADLRRLLVCCYTSSGGEREAHFGVESLSSQEATFYCCCCDEQEVLALARDLHRRLQSQGPVPLEVLETTEDEAWQRANPKSPAVLPRTNPLWVRWYVWYPWHVAGLVGLVALWRAVASLDFTLPGWVSLLFLVGILSECAVIGNRPSNGRKG
jgi:hypothetical protein